MRLPIHCCCNPRIRYGWLDVAMTAPGPISIITRSEPRMLEPNDPVPLTVTNHVIRTEVMMLRDGLGDRHLAIKSAHQPIELWRRVPGFLEDHQETER